MIKFAAKYQKQLKLACSNEQTIYIYRYLLACTGRLKAKSTTVYSTVGKYLLYIQKYHKAITSLSHTRNFCMMSGRTRGIYRNFQFSRMTIREATQEGKFLGIIKTS